MSEPRIATPMVPPTWRTAWITADPTPLRSPESCPMAAFMDAGSAKPSPTPSALIHTAAKPYVVPIPVVAPTIRAAAMNANPSATVSLAPTARARRSASTPPTMRPPISGRSRRPLPRASAPSTPWKYCGMEKISPNIANETAVARMVPQEKLGERNNSRSRSAWPCLRIVLRSQSTNTDSRMRPASSGSNAVTETQPFSPASMAPYVTPTSPRLEMTMPLPSRRGRSAPRDSGMNTTTAIRASTTTGTLIRNTDPHQKCVSSHPPRMGPTGYVIITMPMSTVRALARSRSVKRTGKTAKDSGMMNAAPRPSTVRAATRPAADGEYAHTSDAAPNRTRAATSSRLRPNRSPSRPAGKSMAAKTRL